MPRARRTDYPENPRYLATNARYWSVQVTGNGRTSTASVIFVGCRPVED